MTIEVLGMAIAPQGFASSAIVPWIDAHMTEIALQIVENAPLILTIEPTLPSVDAHKVKLDARGAARASRRVASDSLEALDLCQCVPRASILATSGSDFASCAVQQTPSGAQVTPKAAIAACRERLSHHLASIGTTRAALVASREVRPGASRVSP